MADYMDTINATCPMEIASEIAATPLDAPEFLSLARGIEQKAVYAGDDPTLDPACLAGFLGHAMSNVKSSTDPEQVKTILSASLVVDDASRDSIRAELAELYDRISRDDLVPRVYFYPLMDYSIDRREQLDPQFEDARIATRDDPEWYYAVYLVSLGDERGLEMLDDVLTRTEQDVHNLNGMLISLAETPFKALRPFFERYAQDERRGIGVDGPGTGPSPKEIAGPILSQNSWR